MNHRLFGVRTFAVLTCLLATRVLEASTLRAAEVFQLTHENRAAIPHGKEADGRIGDWVIRNDLVVAVIGAAAPVRDVNQMTESAQGCVIDFTTCVDNNDQLTAFYPMGYRLDVPAAVRAEIVSHTDGTAELKMTRLPTADAPCLCVTTYTLADGERWLHVRTVYENQSAAACAVETDDRLKCDNRIVCLQSDAEQPVLLLDDPWDHAAYGVCSDDGRTQRPRQELNRAEFRNMLLQVYYPRITTDQKPVTLGPGARLELNRALIVGRDASEVQRTAAGYLGRLRHSHLPIDSVGLRVTEASGAPIPEVFLTVAGAGGVYATSAITDASGAAQLPLPDGTYDITASQVGRRTIKAPLVITHHTVANEALVLGPKSQIEIDIREGGTGRRMPVKVEFRYQGASAPKLPGGADGEATDRFLALLEGAGAIGSGGPNLGPDKRANGADNLYYSHWGHEAISVPPGNYEVHISRGPEYQVLVRIVTLAPGGYARIEGSLARQVSSPHWVIADLHNHDTRSGDSNIGIPDKVLNLAGAGIEFAPATNHNFISSYTDEIKALGLGDFLASTPGIEDSGRPGPPAINHENAFPLTMHEDQEGNGAPARDPDPYVQTKRLFEYDPGSGKVIQHNHPDIPWLYFDRNRRGVVDGGFGTRAFDDAMEISLTMLDILRETDPASTVHGSRVFYWLQMLNQGDRIFGTGNSDAHGVGHICGSTFNYVHVGDDEPSRLDPWEIARSVRNGHVVISNGPFLDVTIDGGIPGDTVKTPAGTVPVKIQVQTAEWAKIDRVQILVNGRQIPEGNLTRAKNPEAFGDGVIQFDRTVPIRLTADANIIVVATGEHSTVGTLLGGRFAGNRPMALSNPIFVNVGGSPFVPCKDTLGAPLPTAKRPPATSSSAE